MNQQEKLHVLLIIFYIILRFSFLLLITKYIFSFILFKLLLKLAKSSTPNKLFYITGDIGYKESNGFICALGRNDDMIKVAGHRLSTGKIEEIIEKSKK